MPHFESCGAGQTAVPGAEAFRDLMPKEMPSPPELRGNLAILIDRVDKLISLLEPPSSIIITGKAAVEEFEQLILRKAR